MAGFSHKGSKLILATQRGVCLYPRISVTVHGTFVAQCRSGSRIELLAWRHRRFSPRNFSTSALHFRQKQVQKSSSKDNSQGTQDASSAPQVDVDDYSAYHAAITAAHEQLRHQLSRIKVGGIARDLEAIENIRVRLNKSKNGKGDSVTVGDVASVVPRGKNVHVIVGEKEHVKFVTSALAQPPESLNTLPSPEDPLTLMISIPPITQTARTDAVAVASERGEAALFALREARGAQKKKLRAYELNKLVGPDKLRRMEKELEKINEKASSDAKKLVDECKRKLLGR